MPRPAFGRHRFAYPPAIDQRQESDSAGIGPRIGWNPLHPGSDHHVATAAFFLRCGRKRQQSQHGGGGEKLGGHLFETGHRLPSFP